MRFQKFIAGFDVHGDNADKAACDVFFRFVADWKPSIRVMGGDLWDFRPLRKKASDDEKRESMAADYRAGIKFLTQFKPTHFLLGNHDARLWELAEADNGVRSDYARDGIAEITKLTEQMDCALYPYHKRDGVCRLGSHLKIIHGFHSGVFAARQTALVYGSCLFGHVHTIDEHSIPGLERRVARACGCLCKLDMEYSARTPSTLRQAHGFAYGVIDTRSGAYHSWIAESINGAWLIPSDIESY